MKLSKAQQRVLAVMAEPGVRAHKFTPELTCRAFLSKPEKGSINHAVRPITLDKLEDKGLIENITDEAWRWRGSTYIITNAGRAELRQPRLS